MDDDLSEDYLSNNLTDFDLNFISNIDESLESLDESLRDYVSFQLVQLWQPYVNTFYVLAQRFVFRCSKKFVSFML